MSHAVGCQMCGAHLFETDVVLSAQVGEIVWSHLEDTGCDDPVPVEMIGRVG